MSGTGVMLYLADKGDARDRDFQRYHRAARAGRELVMDDGRQYVSSGSATTFSPSGRERVQEILAMQPVSRLPTGPIACSA